MNIELMRPSFHTERRSGLLYRMCCLSGQNRQLTPEGGIDMRII